jgi:hypothetical protein
MYQASPMIMLPCVLERICMRLLLTKSELDGAKV